MQPFFLHTARRDWRALSCFFLATLAMAAEGAPLNAWTPAQAEAAGVRTLTLAAAPVQPSAGLVLQGQVELPPQARDDLRQGRRAVLAWRDQTVRVVNLPAISRSAATSEPLLVVLVQAPGDLAAPIGIAIRSLCDWLPAHTARRSGMRMGAMGELGLINAKGAVADHANLVVVDLAQMAYLLG